MDKAAWDKAHGNCFSDRGRAEEAREVLKHYLKPYSLVKERFIPNNMEQAEFDAICNEMEKEL